MLKIIVSIHAPPEGRDREDVNKAVLTCRFQSTRPRRGAMEAGVR